LAAVNLAGFGILALAAYGLHAPTRRFRSSTSSFFRSKLFERVSRVAPCPDVRAGGLAHCVDGRQKKHVPALDESLLRLLNLVMHDGANVRVRYRARFETVLQGALHSWLSSRAAAFLGCYGFFTPSTPVLVIMSFLLVGGFVRSLEFTSLIRWPSNCP
jgi:hypothetical protein